MSAMQATVGDRKRMRVRYDWRLISAAAALLGLGVVMVASASLHKLAGAPLYYLTRHLIAIGIGVVGMWLMTRIPIREWERWGTLLFFLGMLLLVLVLVPGVGREANGATRWIPVGAFNLQSSEFMKLFVVFYLAGYLVRRQIEVARQAWGFIKPMILLVMACVLIMLEPDFGTTAVLLATALGLLFLGGVPVWQFALLIGLSGVALTTLVLISPYRLQRISSFLDPWADALDSGYQLSQALIAFGRGEWFGVGLGNGIQKQFYLPEAHTDFLMAVIGEELGLLGTLVVIALFGFIVWRAFAIGARAERLGQRFASYVAQGFGLWIGLQAFINIGVNIGLLPTKGLTLPLLSYGGNSIIVACMAIGLLLRIDYELNLGVGPDSNPKEAQWAGA
ncbi:MAG: putative lipid II flippase FtsW [Candidatus Sedimenticola endophacoides]|uniref:Probable peptidoglycan glycosyltransferase FtsW n=1 Tax=Candidatus Sedimenticola endophacoides TaxID=2548426 RepID=A0A657PQ58_9GAMM|nr:MAG: putative lipid II flippase FtsW [Candidatus Sedimenticola endophacoides]OQX34904.1 MAG: putative lipid II flippase FtsW [Candidatus Sedimenticola endophacoides]OQX36566.1 MAG: putative lipid II flippase FtsW [Candidatus Sedimenticola endophacoides]OQX40314.1 MAG: putative lipid II flippase FtsW [Candidatus Sedimenticola endophacoides]OQX43054.1 MAG: putative lipid II flippase FtsW [Candidatus Sedimenticola endophacoides]